MIFGTDRNELRAVYARAWQKYRDRVPLSALEEQVAKVIGEHPEYHGAVERGGNRDYTVEAGETNPFLHMGLHLGLREQVATDRPAGIAGVYRSLIAGAGDVHEAEHRMMDVLAETLWEAQRANAMPDERSYLDRLRRLSGRARLR